MPITSAVVISLIVVYFLKKTLMIVPEGTVVKTFALGKSHKSFGRGFHIVWFDTAIIKQIRLKVGTVATASSESSIEVEGYQIAAKYLDTPQIGNTVRVVKFDEFEPIVTHQNVPNRRKVVCEKCGHTNNVST